MSLAVVYREHPYLPWLQFGRVVMWTDALLPYVYDPNGRDGEWPAVAALPYETVEHDGMAVPAFEGDVERLTWEPSTWTRTAPPRRWCAPRLTPIDLSDRIDLLWRWPR